MKQWDDLFCVRVDACHIGSFAKIAAVACEGEIVDFIRAAVLFGDDVFDMMASVRRAPAVAGSIRNDFSPAGEQSCAWWHPRLSYRWISSNAVS
jgi:hypothetical protein